MNYSLKIFLWILVFDILFSSCTGWDNKNEKSKTGIFNEKYRPQFHFSPEAHWMNDPNGLVFLNGEYHLFYQYYPDSTIWGPMHWGHAVSTDLIHWQNLPIALYPDSLGYIFSGSAVVDINNTSGFGSDHNLVIVAVFTIHDPVLEKNGSSQFQNQGIAFSIDKGRTFTKYPGNPVLKNPGIRDFRDPKVFWYENTRRWIMILAVHDKIYIYSSPDLKNWSFESLFGIDAGAHGGVWECPDLFQLQIRGTDTKKWIMLVSINPGGPNGGSATQYFTGDFDGHRFVPDNKNERWIDYGRDNYAGVTWSNIPDTDGRKIFIGWMSNWDYATIVPTSLWRSANTLPRELSLIRSDKELVLVSKPVRETEKLRRYSYSGIKESQIVSGQLEINSDSINLMQCELEFEFNVSQSSDSLGIILRNKLGDKLVLGYSSISKQVYVDRTNAGKSAFSDKFAGIAVAPYMAGSVLKFHLYIDASSTELFVDDGKLVLTNLIFPVENYDRLTVFSSGGQIMMNGAELHNLASIWR